MTNKKLNNNGNQAIWDQNLGTCYRMAFDVNLDPWETAVYMYIAKRTVGYMQAVSTALPLTDAVEATGISVNKISRVIKRFSISKGLLYYR